MIENGFASMKELNIDYTFNDKGLPMVNLAHLIAHFLSVFPQASDELKSHLGDTEMEMVYHDAVMAGMRSVVQAMSTLGAQAVFDNSVDDVLGKILKGY